MLSDFPFATYGRPRLLDDLCFFEPQSDSEALY